MGEVSVASVRFCFATATAACAASIAFWSAAICAAVIVAPDALDEPSVLLGDVAVGWTPGCAPSVAEAVGRLLAPLLSDCACCSLATASSRAPIAALRFVYALSTAASRCVTVLIAATQPSVSVTSVRTISSR